MDQLDGIDYRDVIRAAGSVRYNLYRHRDGLHSISIHRIYTTLDEVRQHPRNNPLHMGLIW